MRYLIFQHNKVCSEKYSCLKNQVQEEEAMWKAFNPIHRGLFGFFLAFLACVVIKISKTKNNLSMKLSSQKHISFVFIVCLFWCLVCVTWCDYDATSITTPCKLCKLDIYLFTKNHLELFTLVKFMYY